MAELSREIADLGEKLEKFKSRIDAAKNSKDNRELKLHEFGLALKDFGEACFNAIDAFETKLSSAITSSLKANEKRDAAMDASLARDAIAEVHKVCQAATQQEYHVKVVNAPIDKTLSGPPEGRNKALLEALPPSSSGDKNIATSRIRTLGKPRDNKSTLIVECKDLESKKALIDRCRRSKEGLRATNFLPKYLHAFSSNLHAAYRKVPSFEEKWISIRYSFQRRNLSVFSYDPSVQGSSWEFLETFKIPIPAEFVTDQVKQIAKSKHITDPEMSQLVPPSIDL